MNDTTDLDRRLLDAELNHNEWRWGWLAEIREALQRQRETIAERDAEIAALREEIAAFDAVRRALKLDAALSTAQQEKRDERSY